MNEQNNKYNTIKRKCRDVDFIRDLKIYIIYFYIKAKKYMFLKEIGRFLNLLIWWLICFVIFILLLLPAILCYILSKFTKEEIILFVGSNKSSDKYDTCILNWIFNKKEKK